jgi:hypothetical protein
MTPSVRALAMRAFPLVATLALALALVPALAPALALPSAATAPTSVGHVFLILLENQGYNTTFRANSQAPYLAHNLTAEGKLLRYYFGIGHSSLPNYIAMVSGQAPNVETQADCPVFNDFVGALTPLDGQAVGQGCVYPADVLTIGDQLEATGRSWRMYGEDMAASPISAPTSCRHPTVNARDPWQGATASDQYATRHVPFVYFHSVIDDAASCRAHVVDLSLLTTDLASVATTPDLAFITPDLCSDGHDRPCVDGRPGGYVSIDDFLRTWVPRITASPAFQQDGLLVVTFDEGTDNTQCCGQPTGYNTAMAGLTGPGGGRVGAVLLSPCLTPGTIDDTGHNHYSLLRTMEDVFGLPRLGYAAQAGLADIALEGCSV